MNGASSTPSEPGKRPDTRSSADQAIPKTQLLQNYQERINEISSGVKAPSIHVKTAAPTLGPIRDLEAINKTEDAYRRGAVYFDSLRNLPKEAQLAAFNQLLQQGILSIAPAEATLPSMDFGAKKTAAQIGFFLDFLHFASGILSTAEKLRILEEMLPLASNSERIDFLNSENGTFFQFPALRDSQKLFVFSLALDRAPFPQEEKDKLLESIRAKDIVLTGIRIDGHTSSPKGRLYPYNYEQGCIITKPEGKGITAKRLPFRKEPPAPPIIVPSTPAPEVAETPAPLINPHTTLKEGMLTQNYGLVLPAMMELTKEELLKMAPAEQNAAFDFLQIDRDMQDKLNDDQKQKLKEYTFWKMEILLYRLADRHIATFGQFQTLPKEERERLFRLFDEDHLWPVDMPHDIRVLLRQLTLFRAEENQNIKDSLLMAATDPKKDKDPLKDIVLPPLAPALPPVVPQEAFVQHFHLEIEEATKPLAPTARPPVYSGAVTEKRQTQPSSTDILQHTQFLEKTSIPPEVHSSLRLIDEMKEKRDEMTKRNSRTFFEMANTKEQRDYFKFMPEELDRFLPVGSFYKVYNEKFEEVYPQDIIGVKKAWRQGQPLDLPLSNIVNTKSEIVVPKYQNHIDRLGSELDIIDNPNWEAMPDSEKVAVMRLDNGSFIYLKPHFNAGALLRIKGPNVSIRLRRPLRLYEILDVDNADYRGYVDRVDVSKPEQALLISLRFDDSMSSRRKNIKIDLTSTAKGVLEESIWKTVVERYSNDPDYHPISRISHDVFVNNTPQGNLNLVYTDIIQTQALHAPNEPAIQLKRVLAIEPNLQEVCLFEWRSDMPVWQLVRKEDEKKYIIEPMLATTLSNLPVSNANTDRQFLQEIARLFGRKYWQNDDGSIDEESLQAMPAAVRYDLEYPSWKEFQHLAQQAGRIVSALMDMTYPANGKPAERLTDVLPSVNFIDAVHEYLYDGTKKRVFPLNLQKLKIPLFVKRFETSYCNLVLQAYSAYIQGAFKRLSANAGPQHKEALATLKTLVKQMHEDAEQTEKFEALYNSMSEFGAINVINENLPPEKSLLSHADTHPETGLTSLMLSALIELSELATQHGIAPVTLEENGKPLYKTFSVSKRYSQESLLRTVHGEQRVYEMNEKSVIYSIEAHNPFGEKLLWQVENIEGQLLLHGCSVRNKQYDELLATDPVLAQIVEDSSMGIFGAYMDGPVKKLFDSQKIKKNLRRKAETMGYVPEEIIDGANIKADMRGTNLWLGFTPFAKWYKHLATKDEFQKYEEEIQRFKEVKDQLLQNSNAHQ